MANFTVIVASGAVVRDWLDPASSSAPSRLNAHVDHPMKRYIGKVAVPVVLKAVVGGVVGPADGALGGNLFVADAIEAPSPPFVGITQPFGFSSIITVMPDRVGHYTIRVRRPDGGNEHVHLDVG